MIADDILLLKLIQSKDEQAFKYLFDIYFVPLCRYAHLFLNNTADGEDLVLDIMTYLWEHADRIQLSISLKAYLFQMTHNRCLNLLRDKREALPIEMAEYLADSEGSNQIEMEELRRLIQEAICSLPEKCQEVFLLSREQNYTNQQIADEMNISIKTVEAQITKALKRIKKYLGRQYTYLF